MTNNAKMFETTSARPLRLLVHVKGRSGGLKCGVQEYSLGCSRLHSALLFSGVSHGVCAMFGLDPPHVPSITLFVWAELFDAGAAGLRIPAARHNRPHPTSPAASFGSIRRLVLALRFFPASQVPL